MVEYVLTIEDPTKKQQQAQKQQQPQKSTTSSSDSAYGTFESAYNI